MPKRIPKSLHRLLGDLDDHLYLLSDALARLSAGESVYLKSLVGELRVLVCHSGGTEGLLWRLADELKVEDHVHVHLAGSVNRDHPLAKGVNFFFIPMKRAGEGDPRLAPGKYSLRGVIKKCDALLALGQGYTHEQLIKDVSQQTGSAHEDDGVDPHLVELSGIALGDKEPLVEVLKADADFVLEVGRRVLERASQSVEFAPKVRPVHDFSSVACQQPTGQRPQDFQQEPLPIPAEGTMVFGIDHPDQDWTTNTREYSFGAFRRGLVSVRVRKRADTTLELKVEGLRRGPVIARQPIPPGKFPGVQAAIVWTVAQTEFYLNGQCVETVRC